MRTQRPLLINVYIFSWPRMAAALMCLGLAATFANHAAAESNDLWFNTVRPTNSVPRASNAAPARSEAPRARAFVPSAAVEHGTANVNCEPCRQAAARQNANRELVRAAFAQNSRGPSYPPSPPVSRGRYDHGDGLPDSCDMVMDISGNPGPVGNTLIAVMSQNYLGEFTSPNALTGVCPKFPTMAPAQKLRAWAWFWMVLGKEESGCNPNKYHSEFDRGRRINRVPGWGMWTAELAESERKGRGPMCAGNIKDVNVQVRCHVHTMATQLQWMGGIRSQGSYYGPVRRANMQIVPNMRKFPGCYK